MFLTKSKLNARIQEISEMRYRDTLPIASFACKEDEEKKINGMPPQGDWSEIRVGDHWKGRDAYIWLSVQVSIPAEWNGRKIVGRFDFGNTGAGNNSGFESLLYVNGVPYQGVDSNHQEVFLPTDCAGTELDLLFRLWSGLEGGGKPAPQEHTLMRAEIGWLDEQTDDFYYLSAAALETVHQLNENLAEHALVLSALNGAYRLIDWANPRSELFYDSVYAARTMLDEEISRIESSHPVTVHCIGHTHIDVAWLWRLKHTREKCARSFSTVLRLMELYPEYVFLQTQPQLYEYVKSDFPEIYEQIRRRVQEGRWEAGGGMWLEADCNLTSGESLVRQILLGTQFLREEFGVECRYLWLPDVFGYSWALPQILKKSGISTFMTTKISWNQYNRMPHDTFRWRGIDGTEVLTHFITTPEPWSEEGSWFYTYNGRISAKTVKGIWDAYRNKDINRELLLSYGYGDGGGGVNRDMLEMRRKLDRMPGIPSVKTGTAGDYFAKLEKRIDETTEYVHTWDGELYLEYHRGTYTSQAYNKRMNRKLELLYRETEWLGVLAGIVRSDWPFYGQDSLNAGWKIILRNQFHDIIPGSSIKEVYEDSRLEYEEAKRLGEEEWRKYAASLAALQEEADSAAFTVMNSANWRRDDLVEILAAPGMEQGAWLDSSGEVLQAQQCEGKWLVMARRLPSLGCDVIRFIPGAFGAGNEVPFTLAERSISTPYYDIEWDGQGQLTRIYDREAAREVLAKGRRGNVLQVFEDKPLAHEAWDIDIFYQEKMVEINDLLSATVREAGTLRAVVEFVWRYKQSTVTQQMTLYANSRRIDFRTEADWHEKQQLLKAAFPVEIRATEAVYDIQFGNVKRPTHWNTSWDYARFETVGHQWADLSERGYGVSLLNDCKYGYDIKDNTMRLSLIKSATHPDPDADQGYHLFTYSLLPHQGDWLQGKTAAEAWMLNNPLTYSAGSSVISGISLLEASSPHVMIDAVKKAENENKAIVRLHEFAGSRGPCVLTSGLRIVSWQECDLLERPVGDVQHTERIRLDVAPYEIKTVIVEFSNDRLQMEE
ncbi:alpha-mannosidase [Paenibacillus tarimensis]